MIHVGDDTHNFSIRKDANKEVYDLCPDSPGTSATSSSSLSLISTAEVVADTPVLSYMGPVSGKVILDQKGITSQETALIRQRTEKAEKEARKRKTLPPPPPLPHGMSGRLFSHRAKVRGKDLAQSWRPEANLPPLRHPLLLLHRARLWCVTPLLLDSFCSVMPRTSSIFYVYASLANGLCLMACLCLACVSSSEIDSLPDAKSH